jgi:hypothetical protein
VLVDRPLVERVLRAYARVLPVFAVWLPVSWFLFPIASAGIDPDRPGEVVPLLFFKAGDMAIHAAAGVAFLVLVLPASPSRRSFIIRAAVAALLIWAGYVTATANRGSLVTSIAGLLAAAVLSWRAGSWRPVLAGALVVAMWLSPGAVMEVGSCFAARPATPAPSGVPAPTPTPTAGRQVSVCQLFENVGSIVGPNGDATLEGTKNFRLAWWGAIIDYTVRGPYFWTGKGFGINLADADGFQPTADHSLRAPHNTHMTTLARMGVPGFLLWLLFQTAFGVGLLRARHRFRHDGDLALASAAGWIAVYWFAIMIDTSFDPYVEGPQGGIWLWSLVGLGLGLIRLPARPGAGQLPGGLAYESGGAASMPS